jgi:phosphodiesterase/alkaline phosphatase D-like protein
MTLQSNPSKKPATRGFLALLCALLATTGTGLPKIKYRRAIFLASLLVGGVFGLPAAPALATTPISPTVTIKPVGTVTSSTVKVSGTVNPNATPTTTAWNFQYSKDPETEGWTVSPVSGVLAAGVNVAEEVKGTIEGLQPDASYQVRLVASNEEGGEGISAEPNPKFTTEAVPPTIESEAASGVTSTTASLEGTLNPNNEETEYSFEYSTSPTLAGAITIGAGKLPESYAPATLVGPAATEVLAPGTEYYYRLVAKNATPPQQTDTIKSFTTPPAPTTDPAGPITPGAATLNGHFTLDPSAATKYSFAYAEGTECQGAGTQSTPETGAGTGTTVQAASATITGLKGDVQYAACLITTNSSGSQVGPTVTFTSAVDVPAIPAASEYSTEVSADTAKLHGEVDPGGEATSYHFEYDTTPYTGLAGHGTSTPTVTLLDTDNTSHPVEAEIENLAQSTVYYYRLVASNGSGTQTGPGKSLNTQGPSGTLALPDNRQYELVSPPEKDGAQIYGIVGENGVVVGGSAAVQAAEDGSAITYLSSAPVDSGSQQPAGSAYGAQILSRRGSGGWTSQDISPPLPGPVPTAELSENNGEPYRVFARDLSEGLLQENAGTPIEHFDTPGALDAGEAGAFTELPVGGLQAPVNFQAATPDLRHLVVRAGVNTETEELYEWPGPGEGVGGAPVKVDTLPNRKASANGALLGGTRGGNAPSEFAGRNAVSADGSRVVWGNGAEGEPGETELFTSDLVTGVTTQVDAALGGGGTFQLANTAGTRVFFTKEGGLYLYDVTHERLSDLTPGGAVGDILGANEEGTIVYVTGSSALSSEANAHGEKAEGTSIFMLREVSEGEWGASFIASLSEADVVGYTGVGTGFAEAKWPVRVSANGNFLAFMSNRSLTGYDNRDAVSGVPDEEVFEYHAPESLASGPGSLVCASCDPTGARPLGELDRGAEVYPGLPMDPTKTWGHNGQDTPDHWVASVIPGWNENLIFEGVGGGTQFDLSLYASRVLSNSGRLFFDSSDALVPQDVNHREDVYEYEPGGEGSCPSGQAGCVALISSGQGDDDSVFVDASASGEDVFFTTADRLVPADKDSATDMYDAHVCSALAPCLPAGLAASPPCASTDSCRAAQALQPGVFGPSGSATFSGSGNPPSAPAPLAAKPKPPTRAQLLAKALRACKQRYPHSRKRRGSCERQARRTYKPAHTSKRKGR